MTHNTRNMLVLQYACVVVLSQQYSILTSTVRTVLVIYIVLTHSNKYIIKK